MSPVYQKVHVIDSVAVSGFQSASGFQATLKYDSAQLQYTGFDEGELMQGAVMIPLESSGEVALNAVLLAGKQDRDAGSLGRVKFRVQPGYAGEALIALTAAHYAASDTLKVLGIAPAGATLSISGAPLPPASPDFDGDGNIGFTDFLHLAQVVGARQGEANYDGKFDLNRDGHIEFLDCLLFVQAFGKTMADFAGFVQPSSPGPHAAAVPSLDLDASGNAADDGNRTGTAAGAGVVYTAQVFLKGLNAPIAGARIVFNIDLSKVKLTAANAPDGAFALGMTENSVIIASFAGMTPQGDGLLATVAFTAQTGGPFKIGITEVTVADQSATRLNGLGVTGVEIALGDAVVPPGQTIALEISAVDFDSNGAVGFTDFLIFAAQYGKTGPDMKFDLDRDGQVGFVDFLLLAQAFGRRANEAFTFALPVEPGPNVAAVPALDLDASGNTADDGGRTGTVGGTGTTFTAQLFLKGLNTSISGAHVVFDLDPSKVKLTAATAPSGTFALGTAENGVIDFSG